MNFEYNTIFGAMLLVVVGMGAVQAAEKDGVSCPGGYAATYQGNGESKTMFCEKRVELPSACLPTMNRTVAGEDQCVPQITGPASPSGLLGGGLQYPNVGKWNRIPSANGPDTFWGMDRTFPVGTLFVGDPKKGVKCPTGYDPNTRNTGKTFLCENIEITSAAKCEWGFAEKINATGNKDRCDGTLPPFSKRQTIPSVVLSLEVFRIEDSSGHINWVLNELAGRDTWTKKIYAYPRAQ